MHLRKIKISHIRHIVILIVAGFGLSVSLMGSQSTYAKPLSWLDQIQKGKDAAAAEHLLKVADDLSKRSTWTSGEYIELVKSTANSLAQSCKSCPEEAKITLFRGITPGVSDRSFKNKQRLFFPSRSLMNKALEFKPNGLIRNAKHIYQLLREHSISARTTPDSHFISTSLSSFVAKISSTVIVLNICPERVMFNEMNRGAAEYEFTIPFFIHPNEVFAIIEPGSDPLGFGDFKILRKGAAAENRSEIEIKAWIKEKEKANFKFIDGPTHNLGARFNRMISRKKGIAKRAQQCSRLFSM